MSFLGWCAQKQMALVPVGFIAYTRNTHRFFQKDAYAQESCVKRALHKAAPPARKQAEKRRSFSTPEALALFERFTTLGALEPCLTSLGVSAFGPSERSNIFFVSLAKVLGWWSPFKGKAFNQTYPYRSQ